MEEGQEDDDDDVGEAVCGNEVANKQAKPLLQSRFNALKECSKCTDSSIVDGCHLCTSRHAEYLNLEKCCSKRCLANLTDHGSIANANYVNRLRLDQLINLDDSTIDAYMKQILQSCMINTEEDITAASRNRFSYSVGLLVKDADLQRKTPPKLVCRTGFKIVYELSKKKLERLLRSIKKNYSAESTAPFNDRSGVPEDITQELLKLTIKKKNKKTGGQAGDYDHLLLDPEEVRVGLMPNGQMHHLAKAWMSVFFQMVGDQIPNSNEIHLETQDKLEIWAEYVWDMHFLGEYEALCYTKFLELWDLVFPHVRIRVYKAVTGKCTICAVLSDLRKKYQSKEMRKHVTTLHAFHRIMYMGERSVYYKKVYDAMTDPLHFFSGIQDGMSQSHTQLPWLSNQKALTANFGLHLQGAIEHGQFFRMYISYENVAHDANLAIECLLLTLERRMAANGGVLPDTLYFEMDGGSENINRWTFFICELIVARRLTKRIFITRLPVGHTHEDIDGMFGLLWSYMRNIECLTPDAYIEILYKVFGGSKKDRRSSLKNLPHAPLRSDAAAASNGSAPLSKFDHKEIMFTTDYKALFKDCQSNFMSGFTKDENTQLAFKMEAVPRDEFYPLGVRTMYKAFASDKTIDIQEDSLSIVGRSAKRVYSHWGPLVADGLGALSDGMHFQNVLPSGPLFPAQFVPGARESMQKTITELHQKFGGRNRAAAVDVDQANKTFHQSKMDLIDREWKNFSDRFPDCDCVYEYFRKVGWDKFVTPLRKSLFGYMDEAGLPSFQKEDTALFRHFNTNTGQPPVQSPISEAVLSALPQQVATHSVRWSHYGVPMPTMPKRLDLPAGLVVGRDPFPTQAELRQQQLLISSKNYEELTNDILKAMLQARSLTMSGNKTTLVTRLQKSDESIALAAAAPPVA